MFASKEITQRENSAVKSRAVLHPWDCHAGLSALSDFDSRFVVCACWPSLPPKLVGRAAIRSSSWCLGFCSFSPLTKKPVLLGASGVKPSVGLVVLVLVWRAVSVKGLNRRSPIRSIFFGRTNIQQSRSFVLTSCSRVRGAFSRPVGKLVSWLPPLGAKYATYSYCVETSFGFWFRELISRNHDYVWG